MTSSVSCCASIVNQNKWPTLLHGRADVTTRYIVMDTHGRDITYNRICNKSNTKGTTCETEIAYHSVAPEFIPVFSAVRVVRFLVFCLMLCISLFALLAIALSVVLRLTASDYLFDIFRLFSIDFGSIGQGQDDPSVIKAHVNIWFPKYDLRR